MLIFSDPYKQNFGNQPPQAGGYVPAYPPQGYPQPGYAQPGYPQPGTAQPGFIPIHGGGVPYGHVPAPAQHMPYSDNSSTEPIVKGFEFTDESIRRGFIRKVYSILTVSDKHSKIVFKNISTNNAKNSEIYLIEI